MIDLKVNDLAVGYPGLPSPVLAIDAFDLPAGGRLAVTGASGSGKSTFVNVICGLQALKSGSVRWAGTELAGLSESRRDRWRGAHVGLVMQDFHLFEGLSALDNILLPARLSGAAGGGTVERARHLIEVVGLSRPDQKVETMSRGEMQRVAVARAVLRKPGVVVADEPTASLDVESGAQVADLLLSIAHQEKCTLIVVSHDERLIGRFDRRMRLSAGRIQSAQLATEEA
jgi:putative ABC transport system ATP-binding protein